MSCCFLLVVPSTVQILSDLSMDSSEFMGAGADSGPMRPLSLGAINE